MRFDEIRAETPSADSLATTYAAIQAELDRQNLTSALGLWDRARREYSTWSLLAATRFQQDTENTHFKAQRDLADSLNPVAQGHDTAVKRRLLALPDRAGLEAQAGAHAVRLWDADVTTFDPAIAADLEAEARLGARYTELTSSARFAIDGQTVNLSGLDPYDEDLDRGTRHRAAQARWTWFADHADEFDRLFDEQVRLRHRMARTLGYENFIPLAYRRMRRVDYDAADVARYRDEIATHVTPLMARLLERRRAAHGWDKLHAWDEPLIDPLGNPRPIGGHDVLVAAAQDMFDRMDPKLGAFYRRMNEDGYLDLKTRPTKAPGGFCEAFPTVEMPIIFANFNGTHGDIGVFTHEMGHAIQVYESRHLPALDYLWPTSEAAEINSMALELLSYPHMELLVGEAAADRFRRMHLTGFLDMLLRLAVGDHFQHEVYANPDATPAERHAIYRRLERHYMPWRDYGDLAHAERGGSWQNTLHFYIVPFYFIDYALASCCALQFWQRARTDPARAMRDYMDLAARGGSAPFGGLVASAGLASPFTPGTLAAVIREAEQALAA
jgi:M3 family oligoendopeptidase